MSEAITKACETCAGIGRPMTFWNGVVDCVDCSGTGRVPDEVATLRARLDAATTQTQIVRLTLASVLGRGREDRDVVELAADIVRVVAELRGHVAELDGRWQNNADLTAEIDEARAQRAALFDALSEVEELFASAECTSCGARLDCDEDDDRCVSGECDGDHPCKPECVLDAARRTVMAEREVCRG